MTRRCYADHEQLVSIAGESNFPERRQRVVSVDEAVQYAERPTKLAWVGRQERPPMRVAIGSMIGSRRLDPTSSTHMNAAASCSYLIVSFRPPVALRSAGHRTTGAAIAERRGAVEEWRTEPAFGSISHSAGRALGT